MRLLANAGTDRVLDLALAALRRGGSLDLVSPGLSLFGFAALAGALEGLARTRLVVPSGLREAALVGDAGDRLARNRLEVPWLARRCADWLGRHVDLRATEAAIPQGIAVARGPDGAPSQVVLGALGLTTGGLGVAPASRLGLVQASEGPAEAQALSAWFEAQWAQLRADPSEAEALLEAVRALGQPVAPAVAYALVLHHLLGARGDALDEDRVVRAGTGFRETAVWRKLYRFQRDGVVGALDKLDRLGGCILADSVGLGKTFEALAVIKYHELRNDRVLVLCPKRLRDNWTLYKQNDRRNPLAADRFAYDVLNHTDLSRDAGRSGDLDLAHLNWGTYDLVVIDESHNFRNKKTPRAGSETRYDRLMRRVLREGVKTRVLMLSATPVNNRLADLRNQIAFATEGDDAALAPHGLPSVDATTRLAQQQFNRWLQLDEADRTPGRLVDMLGFDYFTLLDLLTIARSRKHVEKYYGVAETGRFPERLRPINVRPALERACPDLPDGTGAATPALGIREINREIRRLHLAAYAPLRYVLPGRQAAYDAKYGTRVKGGAGYFRQVDREESLTHLLRVNALKRLESAVHAFALTVERQLHDVEATLARLDAPGTESASAGAAAPGEPGEDASDAETLEAPTIEDVDLDDPTFESLLVGRKVKVLLRDVDRRRWRQDLLEDRGRLAGLLALARQVDAGRDAKLEALRDLIAAKVRAPINPGNRKVLVFTAFADTARYLYEQLAPWARAEHGLEAALVTGTGSNQCTLPGLRRDLASLLGAFAPRAKERPADLAAEGELDLLIATDCIAEGQNLQDCDWLVNYDIHWNPVRIVQRFGRIDRLGSPNARIQLVNFWPNLELEEYIGLEQRVSGRMVLLDVSATGEENLIEREAGDPMNDLEYRRRQLLKLQDAVIDLEDLSAGVSIADLTLTDFRIDLGRAARACPGLLDRLPLGTFAVTTTRDAEVPPGTVFCLRADGPVAERLRQDGYPLAPTYTVHVGADGVVLLPHTQAKQLLDRLKRTCQGRDHLDPAAVARFEVSVRAGADLRALQAQLGAAVASVLGQAEARAVESLFSPGGTHALPGERAGLSDFEVLAWIAVLPEEDARPLAETAGPGAAAEARP